MSTQIRGNKQIKNITIGNAQITDGSIELNKLKDGSELLKRDGSVVATGDFDLNSNQLKNVGAPVDANDAVRKADLDAAVAGSIINREIPSGTMNGTNTQFTLLNQPNLGTEQVFLNGALLNSGANSDYVVDGSTITFTLAPQSGDVILVNYITDAIVVNLDISNTLNQFNSRLTTAESELFSAQGDITSLDSNLSGVDGRLTSAEGDITAIEGDVVAVESSVTSLQSSVSTLQSGLSSEQSARMAADSALDTSVSSIQTSMTSLGNRMTAAESDITALEAADAAFDLRAGIIEDGLQAETSARTSADNALSSRVTALENEPDLSGGVSQLQSDVTGLQTDVSNMNSDKVAKAGDTMSGKLSINLSNTNQTALFVKGRVNISALSEHQVGDPWAPILFWPATDGSSSISVVRPEMPEDWVKIQYNSIVIQDVTNGKGTTILPGMISLSETPTVDSDVTTKLYVDTQDSSLETRIASLETAPAPVSALDNLSDVAVSGPSNGEVLLYNGSEWVNAPAPSTFSGSYNDLSNKPSLFDGAYASLSGKPTIYTPVKEVPSGSVNGTNATFTITNAPAVAGTEQVFLNGLLQFSGAGDDYTISGGTITFNTAPDAGWKLVVYYFV